MVKCQIVSNMLMSWLKAKLLVALVANCIVVNVIDAIKLNLFFNCYFFLLTYEIGKKEQTAIFSSLCRNISVGFEKVIAFNGGRCLWPTKCSEESAFGHNSI